MKLHVGITATRNGLSKLQREKVSYLLYRSKAFYRTAHLHHGDCLGGDVQTAVIAENRGYITESHPPTNQALRAFHNSNIIHEPKPYLERDRDIVNASSIVIAMPEQKEEVMRGSGTWYTIRYAKKRLKKDPITFRLYIVFHDGEIWDSQYDYARVIAKELADG